MKLPAITFAQLPPSRQRIISEVAEIFRVGAGEIMGRETAAYVMAPRLATILLLRERRVSLNQIGQTLNRHHTSIRSALLRDGRGWHVPGFEAKLQLARERLAAASKGAA